MNLLIIKLGVTGDVVRTTPSLNRLSVQITWLTAAKNTVLLKGSKNSLRCFSWEDQEEALHGYYDLVSNLEDTLDAAQFLKCCGAKISSVLKPILTTHCATQRIQDAGLV